jgi:hypothetical protein
VLLRSVKNRQTEYSDCKSERTRAVFLRTFWRKRLGEQLVQAATFMSLNIYELFGKNRLGEQLLRASFEVMELGNDI